MNEAASKDLGQSPQYIKYTMFTSEEWSLSASMLFQCVSKRVLLL